MAWPGASLLPWDKYVPWVEPKSLRYTRPWSTHTAQCLPLTPGVLGGNTTPHCLGSRPMVTGLPAGRRNRLPSSAPETPWMRKPLSPSAAGRGTGPGTGPGEGASSIPLVWVGVGLLLLRREAATSTAATPPATTTAPRMRNTIHALLGFPSPSKPSSGWEAAVSSRLLARGSWLWVASVS